MRRDTVNYTFVGLFVIGMFGAFVTALILMTGSNGRTDKYHAYYRHVAGLNYGTPVYFEGYRIGQVTRIKPEHEGARTRYRVSFQIQHDWPVPEDSVAAISSSGLLSDTSIQLYQGKSEALLKPNSEMRAREGADFFSAFGAMAAEMRGVAEGVRPLVDQLRGTMGEGVSPLLADLKTLLNKLNQSADGLSELVGPDNRQSIRQILEQLNDTTTNTRKLTGELMKTRAQVDQLLQQTNGILKENRADVQHSTRELRVTLQTVSARIEAIVEQLDGTTRNMQEFSREIRNNPGRLLGGSAPQDPKERQK